MRFVIRPLSAAVVALAAISPAAASTSLDRIASAAAGRPVAVTCLARGEGVVHLGPDSAAWGYAQDGTAYLSRGACTGVARLLDQRNRLDDDLVPSVGEAFFVLVHEAQHLRGIADEAAADCAALRALPGLLHRLRVRGYIAQELEGAAWGMHESSEAKYRAGCP